MEGQRGLPEDPAARDLHAAVEFLKVQPNVKKDRIASIAWCMGGGYSLNVALTEPALTAVVINDAHLATDPAAIQKIHAAILGNFGGKDQGIPPEDVRKFRGRPAASGQEGRGQNLSGHGFQNRTTRLPTGQTDAADAWQRTVNFLNDTLKN